MELSVHANKVVIRGSIGGMDSFNQIKERLDALIAEKPSSLEIRFERCDVLTSSLIGYLLKIKRQDKIPLTLTTDSRELVEVLESLQLLNVLDVRYSA